MEVCSCPAVVDVDIVRPDLKFQLGFSVQDGLVCARVYVRVRVCVRACVHAVMYNYVHVSASMCGNDDKQLISSLI